MMRHLSVFDLDGTLLTGNSSFRFGSFLYRRGQFSLFKTLKMVSYYGRHRYLGGAMDRVHTKAFELFFIGRSKSWLDYHVQEFLREEFSHLIHHPTVQKLLEVGQRGDHTAIFSSSPDFLVQPIAAHFGVEHWRASHYPVDPTGHLRSLPTIFQGLDKQRELKALAAQLDIASEHTTAYSDSFCDLPFLQSAGKAVAVRPDRALLNHCRRQGWDVV